MNSQYEELYGVGLLDDLHNYFPAVLYQPERFPNVQSLLHYVQTQSRSRFDLFSLGHREYQGRMSPVVPPPPPPTTTHPSVRVNVQTSDLSGSSIAQTNSNLLPRLPRTFMSLPASPVANTYTYMMNAINPDEEDEINLTTHLLTTLLNIPMTRRLNIPAHPPAGGGLDAFMQPVIVRPTAEQITANTTVGNLVSDTEQSCAICQDTLQPEQEGRKLNACGHWFHKSCIDTWLDGNVHCPVCRHDIREPMPSDSEGD